uniref:DUF1565 domain-containing protein n=2 Tax=Thermorudis TaxID=1649508 RepID=A0A7C2WC85_9BACT
MASLSRASLRWPSKRWQISLILAAGLVVVGSVVFARMLFIGDAMSPASELPASDQQHRSNPTMPAGTVPEDESAEPTPTVTDTVGSRPTPNPKTVEAPAFVLGATVDSEDSLVLYVAPDGSDEAPGTIEEPLRTLQRALDLAQPGTTIILRGGVYALEETVLTRRDGSEEAPITIRSMEGEVARLRGPEEDRGVQIEHDWYILEGLDLSGADVLLRLEGAEHVLVTWSTFHNAGSECVRLANQARYNTFSYNRVWNCGREDFDLEAGHKNGEGIYIGTAPEQRDEIGGVPDSCTDNVIEHNVFYTNGSEAVDIKEDSERNVIRYNVGSGNRDPEGAVFSSRGDFNVFLYNEAFGSLGAGFRTGGDSVDGRIYGTNNVFRGNDSHHNQGYGYKFMVWPQDVDCSNTGYANAGQLFYIDDEQAQIACSPGEHTP